VVPEVVEGGWHRQGAAAPSPKQNNTEGEKQSTGDGRGLWDETRRWQRHRAELGGGFRSAGSDRATVSQREREESVLGWFTGRGRKAERQGKWVGLVYYIFFYFVKLLFWCVCFIFFSDFV